MQRYTALYTIQLYSAILLHYTAIQRYTLYNLYNTPLHTTLLPRAAPDPRRPAHREHTAPASFAGGHHRRHPELRAEARCDDAARREEKDLPQLNSSFRTKPQPKPRLSDSYPALVH